MTLESQYKDYLNDHPDSTYSFDEWKENIFHPMLEKLIIMSQEYDRELKDWDNTLMDGLEDLPYDEN
jgi:hypothetical protein